MKLQSLVTMIIAAYPGKSILLQTVDSKLKAFQSKNPDASSFDVAKGIWNSTIRILLAKIYLRNCETGKFVSVNKKPIIDNKGTMIFGDQVCIWSDVIQAKLYTAKNAQLIVGTNSRLNGVHISACNSIIIGKNVRIAPYSIILDSDFHDIADHFAEGKKSPVVIEDDVWIATRATILKGVTVGKGSVVAAGAVVTRDVPPNTVVAGVPAKVIRYINNILLGIVAPLHHFLNEAMLFAEDIETVLVL